MRFEDIVLSINITELAAFLSPFLPFFLKLGKQSVEKTADIASDEVRKAALHKARAIWNKLRPKIASKEAATEAVEDVARYPDNQDMQGSLRIQLTKLLEQDEALTRAIAEIMNENASDGTPGKQVINNVIQNVDGDWNSTIGIVSGSVTKNLNN